MNDWMIKWTAFPEWIVSGWTWLKRSCRDLRAQRAPSWRWVTAERHRWRFPSSTFWQMFYHLISSCGLNFWLSAGCWRKCLTPVTGTWQISGFRSPPLTPLPIFFLTSSSPPTEDPLTLGFQSLSEPHLLLVSLCGIQPPLNYFPFGPSPLGSHPPHRWPSAREQRWESVGRLIYRREGGQQRLEPLHYLTSSYLACILRRGLIYWCFCTFVGLKQQFQRTRGRWRGNLRSVLQTSYESCYGAIILERNF